MKILGKENDFHKQSYIDGAKQTVLKVIYVAGVSQYVLLHKRLQKAMEYVY